MTRRRPYNPFQGRLGEITHEMDVNRNEHRPYARKLAKSAPLYNPPHTHVAKVNAKLALPKWPDPEQKP